MKTKEYQRLPVDQWILANYFIAQGWPTEKIGRWDIYKLRSLISRQTFYDYSEKRKFIIDYINGNKQNH